jgi:hypothetical protein
MMLDEDINRMKRLDKITRSGDAADTCHWVEFISQRQKPNKASMLFQPMKPLLVIAAIAGLSLTASAQITFVNATSGGGGNTALAAGGTFTPPLNGTTGNDDNWEERTVFGSSGQIFEASGEGGGIGENAPRLVTTISGLAASATYNVFAYFWTPNDVNQAWALRAGLSNLGGELTLFGRTNGNVGTDADSFQMTYDAIAPQVLDTSGFTVAPTTISESSRFLWQASLGTAVADGSGQIQVFIDDFSFEGLAVPPTGPAHVNHRTWYDGVGYSLVPEPSTLTLGLLGGMSLLIARRRKA